jgi:hypothetical protein
MPTHRSKIYRSPVTSYSYIVKHDTGFAPNPFHDLCALACCKPKIRKKSITGDWVVGLTTESQGHRLVYAMCVSKKLSFAKYWHDARFQKKRPDLESSDPERHCDDNIYEPSDRGEYRQHSGLHRPGDLEPDLSGRFALVANEYVRSAIGPGICCVHLGPRNRSSG